jgi:fructose-bisphosphate aldolase class 1
MGGEEVKTFSIQSILDEFGYVPLIKMDIEGAEYNVLAGRLKFENIDKFGWCLVEAHAKKTRFRKPSSSIFFTISSWWVFSLGIFLAWR